MYGAVELPIDSFPKNRLLRKNKTPSGHIPTQKDPLYIDSIKLAFGSPQSCGDAFGLNDLFNGVIDIACANLARDFCPKIAPISFKMGVEYAIEMKALLLLGVRINPSDDTFFCSKFNAKKAPYCGHIECTFFVGILLESTHQ